MFCNQCEQAAHLTGCVSSPGPCGRTAEVQSLLELLLNGLRGLAVHLHHARRLGQADESVSSFLEEALGATVTAANLDEEHLLELCLECGRVNLRVLELLDAGRMERFGRPSPTEVVMGTRAGRGILVTGYDLLELDGLLREVEGRDLHVYTHGEMLAAHMYPRLSGHPNLAGHFGGAWQRQQVDFLAFPGPILGTGGLLPPTGDYRARLFTTGLNALPGCPQASATDRSELIDLALSCPPLQENERGRTTIGHHRLYLLDHVPEMARALRDGSLRHIFVIGGGDGAPPGRNYFTDYASAIPADAILLTFGSVRSRIRDHVACGETGPVRGLPRLLDLGQSSDAYGAIQLMLSLAEHFACEVNDLPLTIALSWYGQRSVAVLLALLGMGISGVSLGPRAPAFLSPAQFDALQQRFGLDLTGEDARLSVERALARNKRTDT